MSSKKTPPSVPLFGPFYAAVGVTEMAVEALRRLGGEEDGDGTAHDTAEQGRRGFAKLRRDAGDVVRGATRVPDAALAGAQALYGDFVQRGQRTVTSTVPTAAGLRRDGGARVRAEEARARREARRLARQGGGSTGRGQETVERMTEDAAQRVEKTVRAVRTMGTTATRLVDAVSGTGSVSAQRLSTLRRAAVVDTSLSSTAPTAREDSIGTDSGVSAGVEAAAATRARRVARAKAAAGAPSSTTSVVARKAAEGRRSADADTRTSTGRPTESAPGEL